MNHSSIVATLFVSSLFAAACGQADNPQAALDAPRSGVASLDEATRNAPIVVSTNPDNAAVKVSTAKVIAATFSEAMNPTTINAGTFTLHQGRTSVLGVVSYASGGTFATFVPASDLRPSTLYTAAITTGAKSVAGTAIARSYSWTFTSAACGQAAVALGTAEKFVVLAGSTVTSAGPTTVTGDLGVSPGTAVTGFGPGKIIGSEFAGDPAAATAEADLTTAYNNAAGRTLCPVAVAGNLGGQTLTPGLYKSTSSLAISSGDLTLDAQGDPDAVFIFQMASTLTTTSGRQVILVGGAKATNIYWQVGSSATLGTTSVFEGTIMANEAITLTTGATLNGRALARIAAVTMESNTIVIPSP